MSVAGKSVPKDQKSFDSQPLTSSPAAVATPAPFTYLRCTLGYDQYAGSAYATGARLRLTPPATECREEAGK